MDFRSHQKIHFVLEFKLEQLLAFRGGLNEQLTVFIFKISCTSKRFNFSLGGRKNTSKIMGAVSEFSTRHSYSTVRNFPWFLCEKQMNFRPFVVSSKECITGEMKRFTQAKQTDAYHVLFVQCPLSYYAFGSEFLQCICQ